MNLRLDLPAINLLSHKHPRAAVRRLHHYLSDQAFYPIVLISLFCIGLYTARSLYSGTFIVYSNLVWNLILAWTPYLASMMAYGFRQIAPRRGWLQPAPILVWLLFFPNAPYIMTDFFHLAPRPLVPLWFDILLLIAFSWTGMFLAMASLRTMQQVVRFYLGKWMSWLFTLTVLGLSGVGIYLGRFERWNSWDMLVHPTRIMRDLLDPLAAPGESMRFFGFSVLFGGFLLLCYLVFLGMEKKEDF